MRDSGGALASRRTCRYVEVDPRAVPPNRTETRLDSHRLTCSPQFDNCPLSSRLTSGQERTPIAAIRALDRRRSPGGRVSRITRRRTRMDRAALPNSAVLDQGGSAALRRARLRSRRALALGARPPQRAGHQAHGSMTGQASRQHHGGRSELSSSACQCPSRGRRVKGACGVARDRCATLDPPTAHQGSGAYQEDGGRAGGSSGQGHGAKLTVWTMSTRAPAWCPRCHSPQPGAHSLMPARAVRAAQVRPLAGMSAGCGTPGTRAGWPGPRSPG